MTKKSKHLEWYQNELMKDKTDLDKEKLDFINNIKKLNKEDIIPPKPKKPTLWQRMKKVLMG